VKIQDRKNCWKRLLNNKKTLLQV